MTTSLLGQTEDNQELPENTDYLELLIGPGGKFYDENREAAIQKVAKGKYYGDVHAKTLETRMDELREEYKKAAEQAKAAERLQALVDRLETRDDDLTSREQPLSNEDSKTALDANQIEELLSQKLSQMKTKEKEESNFNTVMEKVKDKYGESYARTLREQAKTLDMSEDEVNSMARNNPKLFFKTFGVDEHQSDLFQSPPTSNVRNTTFAPKVQRRTMSFYQEMRKKDPGAYLDPKTAIQMDKDALALGEAFFDV